MGGVPLQSITTVGVVPHVMDSPKLPDPSPPPPALPDDLAEFFYRPDLEGTGSTGRTTERPDELRELLVFSLANEQFAIDVPRVQEIVMPPPLSDVPRARSHVLGVTMIRGTVVPVFDLRPRLELSPASGPNPHARVMRHPRLGGDLWALGGPRGGGGEVGPCRPGASAGGNWRRGGAHYRHWTPRLGGLCGSGCGDPPARRAMSPVSEPPAAAPLIQLCAFSVGEEEYVLDVQRISTIIRPVHISAIPHAPPFVEGVITLRGSIVPVVDLRRRLGATLSPLGPKSRMMIAVAGGKEVALTVDRVVEVMRITRKEIRPVPPLLSAGSPRFFLGVCSAGSREAPRLRFLLNLKALLESTELPTLPLPQVAP